MVARKGLNAPQNTFLDTIATRFDGTHSNFVLGNAQVPAFPVVYCSDGFCDLTGFVRAYIMQKSCACKFLHGPGTDEEKTTEVAKALQSKKEFKVEIQYYRKNGTPFWCLLDIVPIKNEKHEVVLFLASHKDITGQHLAVPMLDKIHNGGNIDIEAPPTFNANRRRSRAVLYGIQDHYKTNKKTNKLKKLNNGILNTTNSSHMQPLPEYKTAAAKKPKWTISHYGYFKNAWDAVILLATIYVAIIVPFNAAFQTNRPDCHDPLHDAASEEEEQEENKFSFNQHLDAVVEGLFILDILLNFRTTYVNKRGEVVTSSKEIAIHYLWSWFFLDLFAALPFDFLQLFEFSGSGAYNSINLLKLTRLLRLARLIQKMERYSQYSAVILTLVMTMFTVVAHWMACIWFVIAEKEFSGYGNNVEQRGWLNILAKQHNLHNGTCVRNGDAYITALYFTCTSLTTVGFGNVSANTRSEKIYSVIIMLIGALMHATIFGHVTALVQRMYSRKADYQQKWTDLNDFTLVHNVPKQLKRKMQDYFQTMWSSNHGIDPTQILEIYPEELRGDVSMHLHKEVLSLPIFETASQGCLKLISLKIKTNFCAPEEFLIHKGDVLNYIFYLSNGSMEVVQNGMVVALLGKGDMIGCDIKHDTDSGSIPSETAVIKSSSDVRALTYCDLECIHIPGLMEVFKLHHEFFQTFSNDIQYDLTFNLREGYEAEESPTCIDRNSAALASICEESDITSLVESEENSSGSQDLPPSSSGLRSQDSPSASENKDNQDIVKLQNEMRGFLEKFREISEKSLQQPAKEKPASIAPSTATKKCQTDFPASLLESYVINNKKRILKLLDIPYDSMPSVANKLGAGLAPPTDNNQARSWNGITDTGTANGRKLNGAAGWNGMRQLGPDVPRIGVTSATPRASMANCGDVSSESIPLLGGLGDQGGCDLNRKRFSEGDVYNGQEIVNGTLSGQSTVSLHRKTNVTDF